MHFSVRVSSNLLKKAQSKKPLLMTLNVAYDKVISAVYEVAPVKLIEFGFSLTKNTNTHLLVSCLLHDSIN